MGPPMRSRLRATSRREPTALCFLKLRSPVRLYLSQCDLQRYYHEEGENALAPAREEPQGLVFHSAPSRARAIRLKRLRAALGSAGCALIAMGTRGMGSVANLLLGSIASKVISSAQVLVLPIKQRLAHAAPPRSTLPDSGGSSNLAGSPAALSRTRTPLHTSRVGCLRSRIHCQRRSTGSGPLVAHW
jgi:hypothetical protein